MRTSIELAAFEKLTYVKDNSIKVSLLQARKKKNSKNRLSAICTKLGLNSARMSLMGEVMRQSKSYLIIMIAPLNNQLLRKHL